MKPYINTTILFNRAISLVLHLIFVLCVSSSLEAAPLRLKAGTIDPVSSSQPKLTIQSLSATSQGMLSGVYIIQSKDIITPVWREALLATGAKIRSYIPENAYLIEADEACLQSILQELSYDNLIPYAPMYKYDTVASTIIRKAAMVKANQSSAQVATASEPEEKAMPFTISLWDVEGQTQLTKIVTAQNGCRIIKQDGAVMIAMLTGEAIEALAVLPTVHWIEEYIPPKLFNDVALEPPRMNVTPTWPGGTTGWNLTGKGQIVAVCDTGLDTGDKTLHEDLRGRVSRTYALGRSTWDDPDGHGTHVAGSVLGNGTRSNGKIRGAAYEATLIFQSTHDNWGGLSGLPADLNISLFPQTYQREGEHLGARIHTNSWGGNATGMYTVGSRAVDQFLFSHPDFFILFAAGNDGVDIVEPFGVIDNDSMGAPATAKNCLTVGASENERITGGYAEYFWGQLWSDDYGVDPIKSDYTSRPDQGDIQGMAAFSSRGPCDDGRIKPDIVAPGTNILSLKSSIAGVAWGAYDDYYNYSGGTSMSTPLTAGAVTLVREWLVKYQNIPNPDGATIKALLLAGAKSLYPGQYGTGSFLEVPTTYPNNVEGWGQVDLANTLGRQDALPLIFDAQVITQGETDQWQIQVERGADLSIILAYTDAPASLSSSRQLVNDLDLLVTTPSGAEIHPNSRSSADRINNVEGVRIANAVAGTYTISVNAYRIPTPMATTLTGGIANAQRFSLVVNGAELHTQSVSSLSILGEASIFSEHTTTYTCQVSYPDGSPINIKPVWSLSSTAHATLSTSGVLTAKNVTSPQRITLTASYSGKSVTKQVTVEPAQKVTVSFDPQGGRISSMQEIYTIGATYDFLPIPTKEMSDSFKGWYTSETGGDAVTLTSIVTATSTLYAQWFVHPDAITIPDQGGTRAKSLSYSGIWLFDCQTQPDWISELAITIGSQKIPLEKGKNNQLSDYEGRLTLSAKVAENKTGYRRSWILQITIVHENGSTTTIHIPIRQLPPLSLNAALDNTSLTFTTGGDAPWFGQTTTTHDNTDAAQSGAIGHNEESWMQTTVTGPGTLSFWWHISTYNYNRIQFVIDGTVIDEIEGRRVHSSWSQRIHEIPSGSHTLRWHYSLWSASEGTDCAWVDQVTWVTDIPPPPSPVRNVAVRSRWPFEKKVDISYDIVSSDATEQATVSFKGRDQTRNAEPITLTTLTGDGANEQSVGIGTHNVVWDVGADYPNFEAESYTIEVSVEGVTLPPPPSSHYIVIDLSGGANATSYPVTNLSAIPEGGWTNDHKTNKLVLRHIEAGTFMMGSPIDEIGRPEWWDNEDLHQVILTKPYYIGVFEVTQKQWYLVMGGADSSYYATHPQKWLSYNMIRGSVEGARWPNTNHVDANSFIGKIRNRTGLTFDLPTEAQWEYACRAGTTTALNSGKNLIGSITCSELAQVGHYGMRFTETVGNYLPNAWGLYDMHGNVNELCLDWCQESLGTSSMTDPVGATSGEEGRVSRGGAYDSDAGDCRSARRLGSPFPPSKAFRTHGFRVATATPTPPPLYYVIDLSEGMGATSYPVTHLSAVPEGGWAVDHKTTKLVLRRIEAGTFMMGSPTDELGRYDFEDRHQVTLTKPYYIGVFEVTQKQWSLVMGSNSSDYKGDTRPVEYVSYNMIRGVNEGAKWPASAGVDVTSFMGKLRAKTGIDFDLPTEAQWEYACRAGTTTALNSGKNLTATGTCPEMAKLGRYAYNQSDGKGGYAQHTTVGSYLPNTWGLYDMHGNVNEWSLDWWVTSLGTEAATDPVGAASGSLRLLRGGSWVSKNCRSASRGHYNGPSGAGRHLGLRLAFPVGLPSSPSTYAITNLSERANAETTAVQSNAIRLDTRVTQGGTLASGTVLLPTYQGAVTLNGTSLPASWNTTTKTDGWHTLGQGGMSANVLVLNEPTILSGRLTQNQTFATDSLTVIHGDVIIPLGKTLTLASGAVLKFASGAQLIVETGGLIDAFGAYLTHFADDTLLGDTNHDGGETTPTEETWTSGQALSRVSFNAQRGDTTEMPVRTYSAGKTYGVLSTPTRTGYTFNGWYSAASGGTRVVASSVVPTGEMTLYARWTVIETVVTPTFTPATGTTFESTLAVTLRCSTSGATIRYTTNGATPTTNSTSYTVPISLTETTTIKARAFKSGMTESGVATAIYTKQDEPSGPSVGVRTTQGLRITITVTPPSGSYFYAVEESIETGITPVDIDNSGTWDAVNRQVKWGPFFDANPRVFSYTIEGNQGTYVLFGRVSVDEDSSVISGSSSITISLPQHHPADLSTDWQLSMGECVRYTQAWKTGGHANMNYMTRGGYLWRLGETYVDTLSSALAPDTDASRWVPAGSAPASQSVVVPFTGTVQGVVREITGVSVSLQAIPKSQTQNYAFSESIPVGLTPITISHEGVWDSGFRQIKWGPFFDSTARTFTYTLQGDVGVYALMGAMSEDGISLFATGDTQVILGDIAPSPIDVPTTWLDKYASPINGDYAEAAVKPTGKMDVHGRPLLYWHEYLTGTDPNVADDIFHAIIRIENGIPVFTWKPDLKSLRVYTQEGKATLTDPWKTPPPDNAQFFRVKVQLP